MSEEKFKKRKSELERIIIDISDLRANHSKTDFSFYYIGGVFKIHIDGISIKKEVVKILKNEWLDLEYIFIKTIK